MNEKPPDLMILLSRILRTIDRIVKDAKQVEQDREQLRQIAEAWEGRADA